MTPRPLSEGNWLQRTYARWATRQYACMPPAMREQAEAIDRFLYSRRGLGFWVGLLCAFAGTQAGLTAAGVPKALAVGIAALLCWGLPLMGLAAWLSPHTLARWPHVRKVFLLAAAGALSGLLVGFTARHVQRHDRLDPSLLLDELGERASVVAPAMLLGLAGMLGVTWAVALVRRQVLERQLEHASMQHERDTAEREAAEARLKVLQAQIQPHFIFNTLAALQHWVDTTDPRAGPLLRSLTSFLRDSTELLGRPQSTLAEEATLVGHYLAIMQVRLGERLRYAVDIDPRLAGALLPPGLLLTLVENAIEHGISPQPAGGRVSVRATRRGASWQLEVVDDGAGLVADWQEGLGLANSRQRLRHVYGERARLQLSAADPGVSATILVEDAAA